MPPARVIERLEHVLESINAIEQYTAGKDLAQYESDGMMMDAVERNLERISEASRHIPDDLKHLHPDIPWRQIAAIGNILRHAYDRVAAKRIWRIVAQDLAPLKAVVQSMIKDLKGSRRSDARDPS